MLLHSRLSGFTRASWRKVWARAAPCKRQTMIARRPESYRVLPAEPRIAARSRSWTYRTGCSMWWLVVAEDALVEPHLPLSVMDPRTSNALYFNTTNSKFFPTQLSFLHFQISFFLCCFYPPKCAVLNRGPTTVSGKDGHGNVNRWSAARSLSRSCVSYHSQRKAPSHNTHRSTLIFHTCNHAGAFYSLHLRHEISFFRTAQRKHPLGEQLRHLASTSTWRKLLT